ncbi:MAG: hypothetical protein U0Y68_05925 [Blastocatellia bacterium]
MLLATRKARQCCFIWTIGSVLRRMPIASSRISTSDAPKPESQYMGKDWSLGRFGVGNINREMRRVSSAATARVKKAGDGNKKMASNKKSSNKSN